MPKYKSLKALIKAHLEAVEPECRWCFAIDRVRIKGIIIAQYKYQDATLSHLSCPRCGGEFTLIIEGWGGDYLKERILKLHPDLEGGIDTKFLNWISSRVYPEYPDI